MVRKIFKRVILLNLFDGGQKDGGAQLNYLPILVDPTTQLWLLSKIETKPKPYTSLLVLT